MSYSLDQPSTKYDEPDPQRVDEARELEDVETLREVVGRRGGSWAHAAVNQIVLELAHFEDLPPVVNPPF